MEILNIVGILGGFAGIASLVQALSKTKVDNIAITKKVQDVYGDIVGTLQDEVKYLKATIADLIREKADVRCDNKNCPNRIPPKDE